MREGGKLSIYSLQNVADVGFMPQEALVLEGTAFFSYRTIGVTRMYAALGANREIEMLVRCWHTQAPEAGKFVTIDGQTDGSGNLIQYRIDVAQPIVDADAVDLTLVRLEDFYDVTGQITTTG